MNCQTKLRVDSRLRAQDRQDQHDDDEKEHAVGLERGQRARKRIGQKADQYAAAIERGNWNEVEYSEQHIDEKRVTEIVGCPALCAGRDEGDQAKEQCAQGRKDEIHGRPRGRDERRISLWIAQRPEIDRHRLGVAEQEGRVREHQQRRQQDRAERVDVFERIEADAPAQPCRVVAEEPRDIAMGSLVKGDGDHQRDDPSRKLIERKAEPRSHCPNPARVALSPPNS